MATQAISVSGAVEGLLDEAVLTRLIQHVGGITGPIYGKAGKQRLLQRLNGYNRAAQHGPWFVLVDLNGDEDCAPPARNRWLPQSSGLMCFRIAVREVESWLLADSERLARFLGVGQSALPKQPEDIVQPKAIMVELAGRSRRRAIREDFVPRPKSGRDVGPAYTGRLIEYVTDTDAGWRPDVAANRSDSLQRCLHCLEQLLQNVRENPQ